MRGEIEWLRKEIAAGFMLLSALNLKGRPAAADLTAVAKIWYGLLSKHQWQSEQDADRVRAVFETIAATATEWPNPAEFIRLLPPPAVSMVPRIEKQHKPTEYGKAMSKAIVGRLKDAPVMNRDWIHGQRHRTVDECKQIYAARQQMKGKKND
ncbi:hypothetical protein [Neisseria sp. S1]|uniref:hypothetical protein n=1 Tax=Neisseria sp. S1 TaxID=3318354 RepID=UPI003A8A836D